MEKAQKRDNSWCLRRFGEQEGFQRIQSEGSMPQRVYSGASVSGGPSAGFQRQISGVDGDWAEDLGNSTLSLRLFV